MPSAPCVMFRHVNVPLYYGVSFHHKSVTRRKWNMKKRRIKERKNGRKEEKIIGNPWLCKYVTEKSEEIRMHIQNYWTNIKNINN